jgi:hypothetical protein
MAAACRHVAAQPTAALHLSGIALENCIALYHPCSPSRLATGYLTRKHACKAPGRFLYFPRKCAVPPCASCGGRTDREE